MFGSFNCLIIFCVLLKIEFSHAQCAGNLYNDKQQTEVSSCIAWGSYNVKTFDDHGLSFRTDCPMTLVSFEVGTTEFRIDVGKSGKTCKGKDCYTFIDILYNGQSYRIGRSATNVPIFTTGKDTHFIPVDLPGISLSQPGIRVVAEFARLGVIIKWDEKNMVDISIDNDKNYNVMGLCGNNDKCSTNDQQLKGGTFIDDIDQFLDNWKSDKTCPDIIDTQSACRGNKFDIAKAERACEIVTDARFKEANAMLKPELYRQACVWAHCACTAKNTDCLCETLDVYAKASISAGVEKVSWRNAGTCQEKCKGQLNFLPCAVKGGLRTCNGAAPVVVPGGKCEEGCYCNAAQYFFNDNCYIKKQCPCLLAGNTYKPGDVVKQGCHTCTCKNGVIDCPKTPCIEVQAAAVGDPHYTTFDGKRFDFMGKCTYYLVRGPDFSIEADLYAWAGVFTKAAGGPTYVRRVIIRTAGDVVEFKPNQEVVFNDVPITRFPLKDDSMLITKPSGSFVLAELSNFVQVQWDGYYNVIIRLPTTMEGRVDGLLGTYSGDTSDDFITPDGEIVTNPLVFGNSWKTEYSCGDLPKQDIVHPCVANPSAKAEAEGICSIIRNSIFKKCEIEELETDYENCVYDTCYCKENLAKCACDSISAFAEKCGKKGMSVPWRNYQPKCKPTCPAGQVYHVCNNGCGRTCEDISLRPECAKICIEGCNCPVGQTMDEDGKCIPVSKCKCRIDGIAYPPGFQLYQNEEELLTCKDAKWIVSVPGPRDQYNVPSIESLNKKCTIKNSVFSPCTNPTMKTCKNMHVYEISSVAVCESGCECKDGYAYEPTAKACIKRKDCPCYEKRRSYDEGAVILQDECNRCVCINGFWKCKEEECELLCKPNDVKNVDCNTCRCKDAYWECTENDCCTKEKEIIQEDCNTCVCTDGVWQCTNEDCTPPECKESAVKKEGCEVCECQDGKWVCDDSNCVPKTCEKEDAVQLTEFGKCVCKNREWKCIDGQCDIWGDSHINTFDGVRYDFQGKCSYTLVQGRIANSRFKVNIANEICSHAGATCLKSFTIFVNIDGVTESITLAKKADLPDTRNLKKLILKDKALFITVEVVGAGIEVFWDTKTWVYVKLDSRWEKQVTGLCGNYNRWKNDDLEVSGNYISDKEAYRFAELWKEQKECEVTKPNENVCDEKRKTWAKQQCNILLEKDFAPCHDTLPVENYYQACVMDSCKCDLGGDCECLCTAIAAYAQQCNNYGIPIKWRSKTVCPIQCSGNTRYDACISSCPPETCETVKKKSKCEEETTCTEGCAPKPLKQGHVFVDTTFERSVPRTTCERKTCSEGNDVYFEGEVMRQVECETCICINEKPFCVGSCNGSTTTSPLTVKPTNNPGPTVKPTTTSRSTVNPTITSRPTVKPTITPRPTGIPEPNPTPECVCTCPDGYEVSGSECIGVDVRIKPEEAV